MLVEHTNPTASLGSWSSSSIRRLRSKELNSQLEPAQVGLACPEVVGQGRWLCYLTEQMVPRRSLNFGSQRAVARALWFCTPGALAPCHPPEQSPQRLFPLAMSLWPLTGHCCEGWQHLVCACTREDNLNPSPRGLSPLPSMGKMWFQCWPVVFASNVSQGYTPVGWDSHTGTEQHFHL